MIPHTRAFCKTNQLDIHSALMIFSKYQARWSQVINNWILKFWFILPVLIRKSKMQMGGSDT